MKRPLTLAKGFLREHAAIRGVFARIFMVKMKEVKDVQRIETTIGDLVCAIADAAQEAQIREDDLPRLTHEILMRMLRDHASA